MLVRAFNSECDAAIGKIKAGNVEQLKKRIESAFDALNKFGQSMNISITYDYLNLRLEEITALHEKELKIQDEKEILREERELQREEEKAQREYEKAIRDEQKAEKDFQKAMERARKELEKANAEEKSRIEAKIADLELQVEEARALSERAKSQAQLTRSGHVYVISNIGAFGENVYKIGLTRRLEPEDRVNELGSASVPF
ncbi:Chromosome segregation ATPase [Raoultella ornithinolytica]|nr:Chromosome segregation ATPase [Raoultella ornithinolytica]